MKKLILFAALLASAGIYAQKTVQDEHAQKRPARSFHAIEISDGIDLFLSQGTEESLAVSASTPEYREKIRTEVVNGVLKIFYDRDRGWNLNWGNRKLKAYVSVKTLDRLRASGGSDVTIDNQLNANTLSMEFSGGSDFKGTINAQNLSISASGGSDAYLSGRVEKLKLDASGGSDIHGYDMISNYCTVETSGGSDIKITANKEISGSASGGSDVYYKGSASANTSKSGGSG
ncbi:MAG: DUF2807 domain-containing protein, partial [Chitinophagaceae bacterium]|nr:DUF2807 domain-containing protein [Chitinophagaceae bacterium]